MTKGELITACIKLMFDNDDVVIDNTTVSAESDYASRTVNIIESINRAIHRLSLLKKLPSQVFYITEETKYVSKNTHLTRYSFEDLMTDYSRYEKISKEDAFGNYNSNISVRFEGQYIVLPTLRKNEQYIVDYQAIPFVLSYEDEDIVEIPYADNIVSIIPYYVKADLYEEDNPNIADYSRNLFEQYAMALPSNDNNQIREIQSYYSLW